VTLTAHEQFPITPLPHVPMLVRTPVTLVISETYSIRVFLRTKAQRTGSRFACSSRRGISRIIPPRICTSAEGAIWMSDAISAPAPKSRPKAPSCTRESGTDVTEKLTACALPPTVKPPAAIRNSMAFLPSADRAYTLPAALGSSCRVMCVGGRFRPIWHSASGTQFAIGLRVMGLIFGLPESCRINPQNTRVAGHPTRASHSSWLLAHVPYAPLGHCFNPGGHPLQLAPALAHSRMPPVPW